ncbi:MAG: anaerobic sulfatase maturase [Phycisphaerae bacterium]
MTASGPFHILTKPIGPICNLDCQYCFYLKKESLFPEHHKASDFRMNDQTLESYVQQYIAAEPGEEVPFAWQGGEPTLLGIAFFRRALDLQKKYCPPGKRVSNAIQTNGTLLTPEWCRFLAENHFLVGLSLDGPRELHDRYRVTRKGLPTFDLVWRGLQLLKEHKVDFNTLTVVHRELAYQPREVYEFLREHGSGYMQFIPLVERIGGSGSYLAKGGPLNILQPQDAVAPWSVEPLQFGKFLSDIFDIWVRRDVGRIYVQSFDVQLGIWAGYGSTLCVFAETCGRALAIEHTGDLYSCDHYVSPEYRLGNINDTSLDVLVDSPAQKAFGTDKQTTLPEYCRRCDVKFACNGECPKNRFIHTPDGEPGLNYLCAGYKHFLHHIRPYMELMAQLLKTGRAPADIMQMIASGSLRQTDSLGKPPGRNMPCPCNSGRKYKKCCGASEFRTNAR